MPDHQPASKKARPSSTAPVAAPAAAPAPPPPPPFGLAALAGLSKASSSKARAGPPPLSAMENSGDEEVWVVHVPRELDLDALDGLKLELARGGGAGGGGDGDSDGDGDDDVIGRLSLPPAVAAARDTAEAWLLRRESAASAAELFCVLPGKGGEKKGEGGEGRLRPVPVARRLALTHDGAARRAALAARFGWGLAAAGGEDERRAGKRRRRKGGSEEEEEEEEESEEGGGEGPARKEKKNKDKKEKKKGEKKDKKKRRKGD